MYVRGYLQGSENGRVVTIGKFPLQTNIVRHDEKNNHMYKHPIKSCLTRTPREFNEWTKK